MKLKAEETKMDMPDSGVGESPNPVAKFFKKQWKKIKIDKEGNEILLKTKINYEYKAK